MIYFFISQSGGMGSGKLCLCWLPPPAIYEVPQSSMQVADHLALPTYLWTYQRYYGHRTWMKTEKTSLQRILVMGEMHLILDLNHKKTSKGWVKRACRENGETYWQSMIFFCNSTGMLKGMNFSLQYKLILPAQIFLIQSKRAPGKGFRTKKEILIYHFIHSVFIVMSH